MPAPKTPRPKLVKILHDHNRAEPGGWLDLSQVSLLTGLRWSEIENNQAAGIFPMRRMAGGRSVWKSDEINEWLDLRDQNPAWVGKGQYEQMLGGRFISEDALLRLAPAYDGSILSAAQLAEGVVPVDRLAHQASGIYFLWREGVCVYVGQTRIGLSRVLSHASSKRFDGFSFVRCEPDQLDAAERAYIDALMPEYNQDWVTVGRRKLGRANPD